MTKEEQRTAQIMEIASLRYKDCEKYSAFISGAIWADNNPIKDIINLNNIWHDVGEEPLLEGEEIISISEYGSTHISERFCCTFLYNLEDYYWEEFVNSLKIKKWAYISDLLPKGGEK